MRAPGGTPPRKVPRYAELARIRLFPSWERAPDGDRLDVLITLVDAYEYQRYPIDIPDPIQAIQFRLDQEGQDVRALVGVIGSRSRVFEVMHGQRPLSLNMIRAIHKRFGIPAEVLIQPSGKRPKAPKAA